MPVTNVNGVFNCLVPDLIGSSIVHSPFDSSTRHPDGEALVVVVSPVNPLHVGCATKLSRPDNKGIFQHSPLFEIREQGRDGLIGFPATIGNVLGEEIVVVPTSAPRFQ